MRVVEVRRSDGTLLCEAELANNPFSRMRGLLGRKELAARRGMLIEPCNSVHMMFMRFPIDVVYLDRDDAVLKTVRELKPYRFSMGGRKAKSALELPAGTISETGLAPDERLSISR
jgi:uncharacterized protein